MEWTLLKTFDNSALADMTAERLNQNDVPSKVDYGAYASGVDGVRLYVPQQLAHRARWIFDDKPFTDEELTLAATGELPDAESTGDGSETD